MFKQSQNTKLGCCQRPGRKKAGLGQTQVFLTRTQLNNTWKLQAHRPLAAGSATSTVDAHSHGGTERDQSPGVGGFSLLLRVRVLARPGDTSSCSPKAAVPPPTKQK